MGKFAFLIHPLSLEDVARYEPGAKGKGRAIIEKILSWMPCWTTAHVTDVRSRSTGAEAEGWFITVPLMPEHFVTFPREEVYGRIMRACEMGAELGAEIVGLGAFTGVVGDGGVTIAERSPIPVTTGNSLTVAAAVQSLLRGAREMEVDPKDAVCAVIGATGSIGGAVVRMLGSQVGRMVLVARNQTRLEKFACEVSEEIAAPVSFTTDVGEGVRQADLIVTATSSTLEIIHPEDLRPGAVVAEVSLPHDVSRRVAHERPDVLVIEGGNMRVPGEPRFMRVREEGEEFDLGLPRGTALACMSETMTLALEGRYENYSLGRGIQLEKVLEIEAMAERHGFALADLRAFDIAISAEQLARTREAARAARLGGPAEAREGVGKGAR
ncbi:MAG TPA: shikimate dehydrogenase [Candidatus Dormibacteraeota bacterium]|nr:shikimate dehydrogenase [Candidatus Dormibacteraeota bacterium]